MRRQLSFVASIAYVLTGLVTVWCLGCSGYEPLMDALFGEAHGMTCASQMQMGPGNASSVSASADAAASVVSATPTTQRGFDCGCGGSCHSSSPQAWGATVAHLDLPAIAGLRVTEPRSVTRAPIVPPPQTRV